MREYVHAQAADLLQHVTEWAKQWKQAAKGEDAEAIHDLRVAIRRLRQCLGVFAEFFPGKERKAIRKQLSRVMHACGAVRDRDIAAGLLAEAELAADSPLLKRLAKERRAAARDLRKALDRWKRSGLARDLRSRVEA